LNFEQCLERRLIQFHRHPDDASRKEVTRGREHLEYARKAITSGIEEMAIVALYSCLFHCTRALLFHHGYKERSHICLVHFLRDRYPKLGHEASFLEIYRDFRHRVLYGTSVVEYDGLPEVMEMAEKYIGPVHDLIG